MKDMIRLNRSGTHYYLDGREVTEAEYRERYPAPELGQGGIPGGLHSKGWPIYSDALAVHPKQIEAAKARNKKHGLNIEYDPKDGRAILPDNGARRKLMKIEGCHDNDCYN